MKVNKNGHRRDGFELFCDKHNHKMAFVRTVLNILAFLIAAFALWRIR